MARDPRQVKVLPVCHPQGCRSYLVVDPTSREACVVDPLLDRVGETLRLLGEENAKLRWVVDTHTHADHLSGAAALAERTGCDVVMHPATEASVPTVRPGDGTALPLGEVELRVHHAPGNTPDSIVLEAPGALFTGDTLLIGTVGLRDVPGSDAPTWFHTLHRLFDDRTEDTIVHPGHDDMGRTMTTLRQERTGNGWLREDDLEAFESRYARDDRRTCEDAVAILEANREGLQRVPRDLQAAGGLVDPAHATEAALRGKPRWDAEGAPGPGASSGPLAGTFLLTGGLVVLATLLGWLVHDLFHLVAGLVGTALIWLGLRASPRRRRRGGPSLYYEGPVKKTVGD